MNAPNQQQIETFVRWLLTAGGPLGSILISRGTDAGTLNQITTLAVAIAPPLVALVWGLISRRDAGLVTAAATVKGAQVVIDQRSASPTIIDIAQDERTNPDVVTKEAYQP